MELKALTFRLFSVGGGGGGKVILSSSSQKIWGFGFLMACWGCRVWSEGFGKLGMFTENPTCPVVEKELTALTFRVGGGGGGGGGR